MAAEIEEEAAEEAADEVVVERDAPVVESAPEDPRPAIDLGPLIEAMIGMGKTSPENEPKSKEDEVAQPAKVPEAEIAAAGDEVDGVIEPVEDFDLSDLEPPAAATRDAIEPVEDFDVEPVEDFDLSDLQPPELDLIDTVESETSDLADVDSPSTGDEVSHVEDEEYVDDIPEDITATDESTAVQTGELGGRGAGFNMRGDDELLRIFQEIETEGHAGDDVEQEVEKEPEIEQQKRIATATLAEIYTIQGLTQKAIETYRELLVQEPDNAFIRRKLEDLEKGSSRK